MKILLKLSDVIELTSLSKSTIYRLVKRGEFPPPLKIGDQCSRWRREDLKQWTAQLQD